MANLKILAINQYYEPDRASSGQILAELCEGLVKRGFEITVITGQPSYDETSFDAAVSENIQGVKVHRVSVGRKRGRSRMRTRLLGYAKFMWNAWKTGVSIVGSQQPDIVLTLSNPPIVGLVATCLSRKTNAHYVYVLTDIHPDIAVLSGSVPLPRLLVQLWNAISVWILKRADTIIVLGDGMRETLINTKGVPDKKIHAISLWGRPELEAEPRNSQLRSNLGLDDQELLLLYAGNMGIMHPLEPILDAAAIHRDSPVRFLFVGGGYGRDKLTNRVEKDRLSKVNILPYQSELRFREFVSASDACIVAFKSGMEKYAVPSRSYTFISAGRPLITIMSPEADIAKMVIKNECGWNVNDAEGLAKLISDMLDNRKETCRRGQLGREVYERCFLQERLIDRYAKMLNQLKSAAIVR